MPLVDLHSSKTIDETGRLILLKEISAFTAETLGKSENYVMVAWQNAPVMMAGQLGDAVFVDVRNIGGLTVENTSTLTQGLCRLLKTHIEIEPERVYVNFTDVRASLWGWDGHLFG